MDWLVVFQLRFEKFPLSKNINWHIRGVYHTGTGKIYVVITYWIQSPHTHLHTQRTFTLLETNQRKIWQAVKQNLLLLLLLYSSNILFLCPQSYCFNKTWQVRVSSSNVAWLSFITANPHPYQSSQVLWESTAHSTETKAGWDSNVLFDESSEHLSQTGRLQWKERFRTPMIKLHYIHSINKYSLSTFSPYKEHIHSKWHIHSTVIILINFHKASVQRSFF